MYSTTSFSLTKAPLIRSKVPDSVSINISSKLSFSGNNSSIKLTTLFFCNGAFCLLLPLGFSIPIVMIHDLILPDILSLKQMAKTLLKETAKVEFYPENRIIIGFHEMRMTLKMLKTAKEKRILRDIRKIRWDVRLMKEYFPEVLPDHTYQTSKRTLAITDWSLMNSNHPNTIWISRNAMKRYSLRTRKYNSKSFQECLTETMVHEMAHAVLFNNPIIHKRENDLKTRIENSDFIPESMYNENEELNHGKLFKIIYSQLAEKYRIVPDPRYWKKYHKRDPLKNLK